MAPPTYTLRHHVHCPAICWSAQPRWLSTAHAARMDPHVIPNAPMASRPLRREASETGDLGDAGDGGMNPLSGNLMSPSRACRSGGAAGGATGGLGHREHTNACARDRRARTAHINVCFSTGLLPVPFAVWVDLGHVVSEWPVGSLGYPVAVVSRFDDALAHQAVWEQLPRGAQLHQLGNMDVGNRVLVFHAVFQAQAVERSPHVGPLAGRARCA